MEAFLDLEIRKKLAEYVTGRLSRRDFEDWFVPVAMDIETSGNPEAIALAYRIGLRFSEYTDGYWTEPELKQMFSVLAFQQRVSDPSLTQTWVMSAAGPVKRRHAAGLS